MTERVPRREVYRQAVAAARDAGVDARLTRGSNPPQRRTLPPVPRDLPPPSPGYVWLEWVGEQSPFDELAVQYRMVTRQYTPHQMAVLRRAAQLRIGRTPGHSREMTKDRDGLTRDYVWGPRVGAYVVEVLNRDADRILATPSGHEFRIVGPDAPPEPAVIRPAGNIRLVNAREFASMTAFVRETFRG